jgi:hypothetical protein
MQDAAEKQDNGEETLRMHEVDQPGGDKIRDKVSKRCDPVARDKNERGTFVSPGRMPNKQIIGKQATAIGVRHRSSEIYLRWVQPPNGTFPGLEGVTPAAEYLAITGLQLREYKASCPGHDIATRVSERLRYKL